MTVLDPHLDIDQVSAAVDGERDPAVAAHLLTCLACRAQVDTWRRALSGLSRLPVPPLDSEAAIAAALATRAPSGQSVSSGLAAPASRGRRPLRAPGGVAAVVVLVVLVAAALVGAHALGRSPHGSSSSSATKATGAGASASGAPGSRARAAAGSSAGTRSTLPVDHRVAGAAGGSATSPAVFADTAELAAQLRRVVSVEQSGLVGPATPCLRQARQAAATAAVTALSPSYAEAVRLAGVGGQVFVFPRAGGYLAVVVRTPTCTLLATVAV
jgi:hypothetical protein